MGTIKEVPIKIVRRYTTFPQRFERVVIISMGRPVTCRCVILCWFVIIKYNICIICDASRFVIKSVQICDFLKICAAHRNVGEPAHGDRSHRSWSEWSRTTIFHNMNFERGIGHLRYMCRKIRYSAKGRYFWTNVVYIDYMWFPDHPCSNSGPITPIYRRSKRRKADYSTSLKHSGMVPFGIASSVFQRWFKPNDSVKYVRMPTSRSVSTVTADKSNAFRRWSLCRQRDYFISQRRHALITLKRRCDVVLALWWLYYYVVYPLDRDIWKGCRDQCVSNNSIWLVCIHKKLIDNTSFKTAESQRSCFLIDRGKRRLCYG